MPVSALPQVDYPTIQVLTFYPGASPEVMASSVTAPLERQFGQVPGLTQMTSTSSVRQLADHAAVRPGLNIDVAEQEVQAAINAAGTYPARAICPTRRSTARPIPADAPILTLALTSNTLPLSKVEDLADTRLAQKISQLPGVGLVSISGGQKPAVRIQANPTALAAYGLSLEDLRTALGQANVNQAKGSFDGPRQAYTIDANDQLLTSDAVRAARSSPTATARRCGSSDVADVDRRRGERQAGRLDERHARGDREHPAAAGRQHHRAWSTASRRCCRSCKASLPPSINVAVLTDRTTTIRASVEDVQFELMLTVGAGGDGDLPVPAQPCRPRSFPAWPCRCRWSARSA